MVRSDVAEREDLEEKLLRMRTHVRNRLLMEMYVEDDFRTLCQVADYNKRHVDDPIQPAPEE